jgi:hypothetical protein
VAEGQPSSRVQLMQNNEKSTKFHTPEQEKQLTNKTVHWTSAWLQLSANLKYPWPQQLPGKTQLVRLTCIWEDGQLGQNM